MGFFSKDIKTIDDLFVHTLRDIYYAENQILKALPDMISKATDPQLRQDFQAHLGETKNQVARLEQVFRQHGQEVSGVNCPAINGIIEEANDVAGEVDDKAVLDAALIAAAQAVEHYEITRYGSLIAWAKQLGREDCAAASAAEPRRGEGCGQEADRAGGKPHQPARRVVVYVTDMLCDRGVTARSRPARVVAAAGLHCSAAKWNYGAAVELSPQLGLANKRASDPNADSHA